MTLWTEVDEEVAIVGVRILHGKLEEPEEHPTRQRLCSNMKEIHLSRLPKWGQH